MATKQKPKKRKGGSEKITAGQAILAAAARYRIPAWVLVGVKLAETGSGGVGTANPFQLEPGTAQSLGVRDVNNFQEAANAAAKLLASYKRKFGSWNAAFEAYNGGPGAVGKGYAYGEAHVKAKLNEFGVGQLASKTQPASFGLRLLEELVNPLFGPLLFPGDKGPAQKGVEKVPEVAEGITGGLASVGSFFSMLLNIEFWIRAGEVLAGAVLIYMGLKQITGTGVSDLPGARAAKVVL